MKKDTSNQELKDRLKKMEQIYHSLCTSLDSVFDKLPDFNQKEKLKSLVRDKIINDKELKNLFDGIHNSRPPRFMMVGRTGMGKSSLINALCDTYFARVSDVEIGTKDVDIYDCKRDGETVLELLDTRGIAETYSAETTDTAEASLTRAVIDFQPDVMLFLLDITKRDKSTEEDVKAIQKINRLFHRRMGREIPVIVVLNRTDILAPTEEQQPEQYSEKKKHNIENSLSNYRSRFQTLGFTPAAIVPVCAYMSWPLADSEMIELTPRERAHIQPAVDFRYNIDLLRKEINAQLGNEASAGFMMASKIETVLGRIARRVVDIFTAIAATVAVTPIPISDIFILLPLQYVMTILVGAISGEDVSIESAKKFILSVGGVSVVGFGAQQLAKLINAIYPVVGSAASSAIASGVTKLLGEAAISYYVEHEKASAVKKTFLSGIKKLTNGSEPKKATS